VPRPRPPESRPPVRALPALLYQQDPLRLTVQRLGRKWTLLLLRDLAFLKLHRFGELLRNNPGLTPRVLARRLREMEAEGLIVRSDAPAGVRYALTPRGEDAVYILLAFLRYGLRHFVGPRPPEAAADAAAGRPRARAPRGSAPALGGTAPDSHRQ
jgi:DNA-binding HxlR family transcriptional regulator